MKHFHPNHVVRHPSMDLSLGADVEVPYQAGSWMHSWHMGKDFHATESGWAPTHADRHYATNPSHPEGHWRSAGGHRHSNKGIYRLASHETEGEELGSVTFSALEAAALRSALAAQREEKVVVSEKAGGGMEPASMAHHGRNMKLASHAAKVPSAQDAAETPTVRYTRTKGFGSDPRHTIARKAVGPGIQPGTVPWKRPSAKPEDWASTQTDEGFLTNGPAKALLAETDMHNQSLPYFASVDPICATIRAARQMPQDHSLYRLFHRMGQGSSPTSPRLSRPFTGHSSKVARSTCTPGTAGSIGPRSNEAPQTSRWAQDALRNPAAFKIKDFENVWGVDSDLLVPDKQTRFGSHTHRDGFDRRGDAGRGRPPPLRVETASKDERAGRANLGLTPRSPIIREMVIARPRANARNRNDIPLVASPPGARAPVSHGSFMPSGPRTVKTASEMFSTSQMHGRGTKYTARATNLVAPNSLSEPERVESEGDDSLRIPFVNLHTFDEQFESPQRLTPLSRRTLEQAGFETGDGNLSSSPRSPLRSPRMPPRHVGSPNIPRGAEPSASILRVSSRGESYWEEDDRDKALAHEYEPARTELLQQFRHDRQRREWQIRGLSRDKQLSRPGTTHGEKVLVDYCGSAEEFEWDDEEKRWLRTFPPRPVVKSKQLVAKKEEIPPRPHQSPTLKMPTSSYGARYICPDNGLSTVQEDGIAKYGLLAMQDRFMQSLRSE